MRGSVLNTGCLGTTVARSIISRIVVKLFATRYWALSSFHVGFDQACKAYALQAELLNATATRKVGAKVLYGGYRALSSCVMAYGPSESLVHL